MIHIIIPVHNRIESTIKCLYSVYDQDCIDLIQITIVNDGSTDNTENILIEKFPDVKILKGDGNLFWGGSVSYAIENILKIAEKNDWILLMNNDVYLKSNSISSLLSIARIYNRKAILGGISVDSTDKKTIIKSGTIVKNWFLNLTEHVYEGLNYEHIKHEPINVDFLTARCLLHPIEIFKKVGNYDSKNFIHYAGDDEFTFRVKKFGYYSLLCPNSSHFLNSEKTRDKTKKNFFHAIFSIRSSSNIINKLKLTIKIVPLHAKFSFFIIGVLKSIFVYINGYKK